MWSFSTRKTQRTTTSKGRKDSLHKDVLLFSKFYFNLSHPAVMASYSNKAQL